MGSSGAGTIGLIGGMSWESSAEYYRLLNVETRRRFGGYHCARSLMLTVDFAEIEAMQRADDWDAAGRLLADAARRLEAGGADVILLCTNTMHIVAEQIQAAVSVPFLHILDAVGAGVRAAGVRRVGLLGTKYTMNAAFYREKLARDFGIEVVVPDEKGRRDVHDVIYDELTQGRVEDASRDRYVEVVGELAARGAEGVVLGCTEITLLFAGHEDASPLPLFDSTALHVRRALDLVASRPEAAAT
ncbi:aspartate/glutamate racemase family protein [Actinomadura rayongensis]|uniref:Amino acid racemase n=1 Tax=Actinomadura rayongensis TaxID=1429076 RepID=A0A6I4VYG5_9ACTN|nr:aspartate/glutamate racemase family protein [Actinomadura rayongensis]MXQ63007.1 amino acid racemase [Actinomadura rayongensis]